MGASGWEYRVPYQGSVEATFIAVQEQVLASGDYIWPWDGDGRALAVPAAALPEGGARRPSSLAELTEVKENSDDFWDEGTHTILDVERVDTAIDEFGTIRPLESAELDELFGTQQPSAADFDRVHADPGPDGVGLLDVMLGERWSGRSLVLYRDSAPAEVYFWGFSGD